MEGLMQPNQLRTRILTWADEEVRLNNLPPKAKNILEALLYRGELPRGEAAAIIGTGKRQARRVVSALIDLGVVTSESSSTPLRLAFPAALASRWMPGLFPAMAD
jgi:Fic family protein